MLRSALTTSACFLLAVAKEGICKRPTLPCLLRPWLLDLDEDTVVNATGQTGLCSWEADGRADVDKPASVARQKHTSSPTAGQLWPSLQESGASSLGDARPEPGLSDAPASQACGLGRATGGPAAKAPPALLQGKSRGRWGSPPCTPSFPVLPALPRPPGLAQDLGFPARAGCSENPLS